MNEYGTNEKGTHALLLLASSQRVLVGHKRSIPVGRSIHVKTIVIAQPSSKHDNENLSPLIVTVGIACGALYDPSRARRDGRCLTRERR
jgi:hypothetical protein